SGQADPPVDPAATERVDQDVAALGQPLRLPPEQLGVELRRLLGFWSVALEPRDRKSHHRPPSREGSTLPNPRPKLAHSRAIRSIGNGGCASGLTASLNRMSGLSSPAVRFR